MLVVYPAALVLFVQAGFRALFRFAVKAHDPVCAELLIRVDKGVQAIAAVFQDVVGVAAYDHAGALFRQLHDHIALDVPKKICGRQPAHDPRHTLGGKGIGKHALTRGMLAVFLHIFGSKTGFQRNLVYQLLIVEGDTQLFSNLTANAAAAAAKLTADGNDLLFHSITSLM